MQNFIEQMILNCESLQTLPKSLVQIGFQLVFCLVILMGFVSPFAALAGFFERRIAGRIQSRVGPNRVGPQGILQSLADGIKVLLKEDIIPSAADKPLFRLAPYFVFLGMFLAFVALPFSSSWIIADLDLGIFYLLAVESLVVVGVVMSGWASNNKWSLLGGMRSAAQIISYEVPVSMTVLLVVLWSGTLSVQGIIQHQGFAPWTWHIFQSPFMFIAFFVFFTGALAEGNRTPFDIPEAESELVSGYNTEYSGFRFLLFFFAEFANLYIIGAVSTILFLGGWNAGPLPALIIKVLGVDSSFAQLIIKNVCELLMFQIKALSLVFVIMQLRWTLPRVRIDQLMSLCWKYLVPMCLINLVVMSLWLVYVPAVATRWVSYVMTALGAFIFGYYFYRVRWQLKYAQPTLRMSPLS